LIRNKKELSITPEGEQSARDWLAYIVDVEIEIDGPDPNESFSTESDDLDFLY
jgi:hypothetical protein